MSSGSLANRSASDLPGLGVDVETGISLLDNFKIDY